MSDVQSRCVVITTNGTVKRGGACVMGRGIAKEAKDRYPGLDMSIGHTIITQGNHVHMIGDLCTFPVKHMYWDRADLELIKRSAEELSKIALENPDTLFILPRPGCGNGGRTWEEVCPIIEPILPDNVHVITNRLSI